MSGAFAVEVGCGVEVGTVVGEAMARGRGVDVREGNTGTSCTRTGRRGVGVTVRVELGVADAVEVRPDTVTAAWLVPTSLLAASTSEVTPTVARSWPLAATYRPPKRTVTAPTTFQ